MAEHLCRVFIQPWQSLCGMAHLAEGHAPADTASVRKNEATASASNLQPAHCFQRNHKSPSWDTSGAKLVSECLG